MKKPYLKLRRRMEDEGLELRDVAAMTGIGYSTLSGRICAQESQGKWLWREVVAICKVLGIPQEQIGEYFFPCVEKGESA